MFAAHRTSALSRLGTLAGKLGWALIGTAFVLTIGACFPPPADVVLNPDTGEPVLLDDVDPILNNPNLTEDEKRQKLLDLGLPEETVDILLRAS